jgi:Domain of unknown function (DU1801)
MAELKTKPTKASVDKFIDSQEKESTRDDCRALIDIMQSISGNPPVMWGPAIVGFGAYHYKYESGQEADWPLLAFSPRKQNLTIYLMSGFKGKEALLKKLGKNKTSVSCLYVKSLGDLHMPTLKKLIEGSYKSVVKRWGKKS